MANKASKELLQAIAVTAELCGKVFSDASARVFAEDLSGYDEKAVLQALARCRKEVRGILSLQDVISRIDDGRPGVEEAWAMLPQDGIGSVVWTDEMAAAWGVAEPLILDGDRIAARMAFKETYANMVTKARDEKKPAQWTLTQGSDKSGRQAALIDAVRKRRMGLDAAVSLLPPGYEEGMLMSLGVKNHSLLGAPPSADGQKRVMELMLTLKPLKKQEDAE